MTESEFKAKTYYSFGHHETIQCPAFVYEYVFVVLRAFLEAAGGQAGEADSPLGTWSCLWFQGVINVHHGTIFFMP